MLASGGKSELVKKGWSYLKTSTVGLLIVMFSYLGILALRGVLQYGAVAITNEGYVVCTGASAAGKVCGLNMTCTQEGTCVSKCEQNHQDLVSGPVDYQVGFTKIQYFSCIDKVRTPTSDDNTSNIWYTPSSCLPNQCPGDASVQCCVVDRYF